MPDNVTTQSQLLATLPDGTKIAADQLPGGELVQYVKLVDGTPDSENKAIVDSTGRLKVVGPVTDAEIRATALPVSATSLPLPTGAATAGNQTTEITRLDSVNTSVASIDTKTPALAAGRVPVDGSGVTQPISAVALPLPTGAATGAKQDTGNTSVASLDTKLPAQGQALAAASLPVVLTAAQVTTLTPPAAISGFALDATVAKDATLTGGSAKAINRGGAKGTTVAADVTSNPVDANTQALHVDGSKVTQPVSGTFWQATQPVSAASLPLPTGAAADATLTGGTTKAISRGGAKGVTVAADVTSTAEGADHNAIDVQVYHGGVAKDPTAIRALTNADIVKAQLQDNAGTGITVGQKAAAASVPVVLANDANGATQATALYRQGRILNTYTAVYRLAARPYALSKVFTANTRVQFATIHHAAAATKTVKLKRVEIALESSSVAAIIEADLVRITAAPATGNPAITPSPTNPANAAAETTCLSLPTTAGTEGALHSMIEYNLGITGAASVVNPPPGLNWYTLWPQTQGASEADENQFPTIRAGVLEGFAVVLDSNAASTVKGFVVIEFTEE